MWPEFQEYHACEYLYLTLERVQCLRKSGTLTPYMTSTSTPSRVLVPSLPPILPNDDVLVFLRVLTLSCSLTLSRFPLSLHLFLLLLPLYLRHREGIVIRAGGFEKPSLEKNIAGTTTARPSSILHYIEAVPPISSRYLGLERPPTTDHNGALKFDCIRPNFQHPHIKSLEPYRKYPSIMWYLSFWILPLISAFTWLGMLLAMFVVWEVEGQ